VIIYYKNRRLKEDTPAGVCFGYCWRSSKLGGGSAAAAAGRTLLGRPWKSFCLQKGLYYWRDAATQSVGQLSFFDGPPPPMFETVSVAVFRRRNPLLRAQIILF
jgi:hypothetical protein